MPGWGYRARPESIVATFSTRCESPGVDPWTCQGRPQRDMLDHHFRVAPIVASTQIETMPVPRWVDPNSRSWSKKRRRVPMGARDQIRRLSDGRIERGQVATASRRSSAEAFAKLQASPNKLNLPPQQVMMLMNMRGGRGGFGGPGGPGGGPGGGPLGGGGPGGPGGPGGAPGGNREPPIKGGFEWIN